MLRLKPKDFFLNDKRYVLHKFPATDGREIVCRYTSGAIPKIGEYKTNEEMMYKIMTFVGVDTGGEHLLMLSSKTLVDNHVEDWESLLKLEMAMMEYNVSFFQNGRISTFLGDIVQNIPQWISKILITLLERSSQTAAQHSTNSAQSTT